MNRLIPTLPLLLLSLSQLLVPCLSSLSVTLAPTEEFCFAFRTPKDEEAHVTGSYDVINDDLPAEPVTAVLFNYETERVEWHSPYGKSEADFSITLAGKYHFCFGNGAGGYKTTEDREREKMRLQGHPVEDDNYDYDNKDGELRTIGFTLRVRPKEGTESSEFQSAKTEQENAADAHHVKLVNMSNQLRDKLELLLDHQEYIKSREATHRHVVEETFTLVMKWTMLEALVLVVVACSQVSYLKKFFETKRYL